MQCVFTTRKNMIHQSLQMCSKEISMIGHLGKDFDVGPPGRAVGS